MLLFLFLMIGIASAEDVVTLKKGETEPFEGTLLSPEAAAKIIVESDYSIQKCKIDYEKKLALQKAQDDLTFKNKAAELSACHLRQTEMTKIYEQQIDYLEKRAVAPEWHKPAWFVGGVLTGVALVYGSSVVLKNIGEYNAP